MRHIYVVTHTQSQHHLDGLVGGWYDSELSAHGLRQADVLGQRIRSLVPNGPAAEIHSSDLTRARQTAKAISGTIGVPVHASPDLRERSYGEAGGRPQAWLDERFIDEPEIGNRMDHDIGIEGAETKREFACRLYRALDEILASDSQYQVIVTHGYAVTFLVAAWIEMPMDAAGYINIRANSGGITHLHEDDRFHNRCVVSLNDTRHLAEIAEASA